jgi:hypothetical protein
MNGCKEIVREVRSAKLAELLHLENIPKLAIFFLFIHFH